MRLIDFSLTNETKTRIFLVKVHGS